MTKQNKQPAVDTSAVVDKIDEMKANLPVDPKSPELHDKLDAQQDKLEAAKGRPEHPMKPLRDGLKGMRDILGADAVDPLLREHFGTDDIDKLKSSQIFDAVDLVYGIS